MLIIRTFEHSIELEQVLSVLKNSGIPSNHMLVVPMDTHPKTPVQFISKSRDLYSKGFEVGMACATASSVVGTSVGFILRLGPIFWGLTAAVIGFTFGFGLYILVKKGTHRHLPKKLPEVTVIVQCPEDHTTLVMDIMWKYRVLTVGQTPGPS